MSIYETRYGTGKRRARDKRLVTVLASVFGVAGVAWIVAVVFFSPAQASGTVVKFTANDVGSAQIRLQVEAPLGSRVLCGVSALNAVHASVGYKQIELVQDHSVVELDVPLLTSEAAVSGLVESCTLR